MPNNICESKECVNLIRLYIERVLGENLKSVCLADVDYIDPKSGEVYTIDIIRFQAHFPVFLNIENLPYIDLYIDPIENVPRISVFGKHIFSQLLQGQIKPEELEPLFISILWGVKITPKGIEFEVKSPTIQ